MVQVLYLDVYERLASFEPQIRNLQQRLFDAYAAEVKRVSGKHPPLSPVGLELWRWIECSAPLFL